MFKKVLGALKKVAPIAAQVGAVTGVIPPGALKALGLQPGASDEDIELAAVKADPSQLAALRKVEADLEVSMAEVGLKTYQAEAADRDSARKREIATKDSTPKIFAWVALGGYLAMLFLLLFRGAPDSAENLLYAGVGSLGTILAQICAYYYGSSSSSQAKDETIHRVFEGRHK